MRSLSISIRTAAITGATLGTLVAIVFLSLDSIKPFSLQTNAAVERLTFQLCPLYILGFASGMGSMPVVVAVTIVGNAILYGAAFCALRLIPAFFESRTRSRVAVGFLLSVATLGLINAIESLPYSSARDSITDTLSLPGGLIAWLFYPGGVHGGHASTWASLAIAGNVLFYSVVWFFAISVFQGLRWRVKRTHSADS